MRSDKPPWMSNRSSGWRGGLGRGPCYNKDRCNPPSKNVVKLRTRNIGKSSQPYNYIEAYFKQWLKTIQGQPVDPLIQTHLFHKDQL